MQKTGWTIHSFFLVLSGLKKSFTLDVITRGQSTTIFLCIGPFSAWWQTNERTNNQMILVQACSWPVWDRQSFAIRVRQRELESFANKFPALSQGSTFRSMVSNLKLTQDPAKQIHIPPGVAYFTYCAYFALLHILHFCISSNLHVLHISQLMYHRLVKYPT